MTFSRFHLPGIRNTVAAALAGLAILSVSLRFCFPPSPFNRNPDKAAQFPPATLEGNRVLRRGVGKGQRSSGEDLFFYIYIFFWGGERHLGRWHKVYN